MENEVDDEEDEGDDDDNYRCRPVCIAEEEEEDDEEEDDESVLERISTEDEDRDAWDLCYAMINNPSVRSMEFANYTLEKSETETLVYGILKSNVEKLILNGPFRKRDPEEAREALQVLFDGIVSSLTLQEITLLKVPVEDLAGFSDVLLTMKSLQTFTVMSVNPWNHTYEQLIFAALRRNSPTTTLTKLHLRSCVLEGDSIAHLAQALDQNVSLKCLELNSCSIGDDHVRMFVDHWHRDSPLQSLSMHENQIGIAGAQLLLDAAATHPALRTLDLFGNINIGCEGLTRIGEALPYQNHLTCLGLAFCTRVEEYEVPSCPEAQAQKDARNRAGRALLHGIQHNVHIQSLSLSPTHCYKRHRFSVEKEVDFYCHLNKLGRYLLSTDHGLGPSIWCHVFSKCQSSYSSPQSLVYYFLREQPNLIQASRKRKAGLTTPT